MDYIRKKYTAYKNEKEDLQNRVRRVCDNLEQHAYAPVLKMLYVDKFKDFKLQTELPRRDMSRDDLQEYYILDTDSPGYDEFLQFCIQTHCEENLLWVTHFRKMKKISEEHPKRFLRMFKEAWDRYLSPNATNWVNLSSQEFAVVDGLYRECFPQNNWG